MMQSSLVDDEKEGTTDYTDYTDFFVFFSVFSVFRGLASRQFTGKPGDKVLLWCLLPPAIARQYVRCAF
jgi:hypothetical protein